jgi:flagella basal body P-ring formation protein FlgA
MTISLPSFCARAALALTLLPALLGAATPAAISSSDDIRAAAQKLLEQRSRSDGASPQITVAALDPRLRLSHCDEPLRASIAGDGQLHAVTTVAVRCDAPVRWSIYLRATVNTQMKVLTARRLLPRGTEITAADFDLSAHVVPGSGSDALRSFDQLPGRRLRLPLESGAVLTIDKVEQTPVVRRGQTVTLLAKGSGLEIRVSAVALADGGPKQRIAVQNQSTHQVVQAVVRDASLVEVEL